jgi:redox-sensitive bicupin YhaK (pirin superfamily)
VARRSHGLQLWVALPQADEESESTFSHTPDHALPCWERGGVAARVLVGRAFGLDSPVPTRSPTLYVDLQLARGATLTLPADVARERALYLVDGACLVDDAALPRHTMAVLTEGQAVRVASPEADSRCVLIGGEPLGHRYVWWNFVSSRKERIVQAADAWAAQPNDAFPQVPGEIEFIPLPAKRPSV